MCSRSNHTNKRFKLAWFERRSWGRNEVYEISLPQSGNLILLLSPVLSGISSAVGTAAVNQDRLHFIILALSGVIYQAGRIRYFIKRSNKNRRKRIDKYQYKAIMQETAKYCGGGWWPY